MKKLFSVMMALCLLLVSFAAVAEQAAAPSTEEKPVKWSDYESKASEFPGAVADLGNGNLTMYVPSVFKSSDIPQEERDKGMFLLMKTEENLIFNGSVQPVDMDTFVKSLTEKGMVATALNLNDIHACEIAMNTEAGNSIVIVTPGTDNKAVVFTFFPVDEKSKDMVTLMVASLQIKK